MPGKRTKMAPTTGRAVVNGFGESTTAHGISHVHKARGTLKKLLWVLFSLGGVAGLGLNLAILVLYYMDYPVITKITLFQNRSLPFPAVTICNTNPIKSSKALQNPRILALLETWGIVVNGSLVNGRKKRDVFQPDAAYVSCEEAYVAGSTSTGVKTFQSGSDSFKAFCIYNDDRSGWVYLSTAAVMSGALNLQQQYTHTQQAKIRIFFNDGSQKDSTLEQLTAFHDRNLTFSINTPAGFPDPYNIPMYASPYLYLGFLDEATAGVSGATRGLSADGKDITFINCGPAVNSYFTFYPVVSYSSAPYGLGSKWAMGEVWRTHILSLAAVDETNKIPGSEVDNFEFAVEMHFGGCGVIELSNEWSTKSPAPLQANSAALGLKFYMSDECIGSPCGLHGSCTDLVHAFTCTCHSGWTGTLCRQASAPVQDIPENSSPLTVLDDTTEVGGTTEVGETTEFMTDRIHVTVPRESSSATMDELPFTIPDSLQHVAPSVINLDKINAYLFEEFNNPPIDLSQTGLRGDFTNQARLIQILSELGDDEKIDMGYTLSDLIMFCDYMDYSCTKDDFQWFFDAVHGNCYVFNSQWYSSNTSGLEATRVGKRHGLRLVLDIGQYEYIPKIGEAAGVVVVVHPADTMSFPEDEGLVVKPGRGTSVALTAVERQRLPDPYGEFDCNNQAEPNFNENVFAELYGVKYGLNGCYKTCYQAHMVENCQCGDPQYPITGMAFGNNTVACHIDNPKQESCKKRIEAMLGNNSLECDCKVPCHEVKFKYTMSTQVWPSEKFEVPFLALLKSKYSQLTFSDLSMYRRNFASVDVFFEDFAYESVQEYPAYQLSRLFTDIGGVIGLWVGCSLFSLVEIVELVADLVLLACSGSCKNKPSRTSPNVINRNQKNIREKRLYLENIEETEDPHPAKIQSKTKRLPNRQKELPRKLKPERKSRTRMIRPHKVEEPWTDYI